MSFLNKRRSPDIGRNKYLYLMLLPGVIFFIVYKYIPMLGLSLAFKNYYPLLGFFKSEWIGFAHFEKIFRTPEIVRVIRNTLTLSLLKILFAFPVPIILAILINEIRRTALKKTIQTLSYLPHFLSWAVFGEIIKVILSGSGAINTILKAMGGEEIFFLIEPSLFKGIAVITAILKNSGWGTIIYLAAISTIDPQLYEAARMDGANRLQRIRHVTLASLKGVIVILLIIRIGYIMDAGFHQVFVLYNNAILETADIFGTFTYRVGISQGQYSLATTVGLFKGIIALVLVWGANSFARKIGEEGVW